MFLQNPASLRLSSWFGQNDRPNKFAPRRVIPATIAALGGLVLFYLFVVPQLLRFRFRAGLGWYDLGLYGFGPSTTYVSFEEESPIVEFSPNDAQCDSRYTFLAPRGDSVAHAGPMILDAHGELVWMKYNWGTTQDFGVQRYRDQDYLTFWQGDEEDGHGRGSWYMLDSTYTTRFVVSPVGDMPGDLHEFHITPNGTALITIYDPIPADLTSVGGPELGWLYDGVFQEIDIASGELLFEWRSSNFYPPSSSYESLHERGHERTLGYDYFHINSVDKNDQGQYLVSGRHTHTVTCVDGTTGEVLWTLGGKHNEFTDDSGGAATNFAWQHDARWRDGNRITLFNNGASNDHDPSIVTHGALLELDIPARRAALVTSYDHPQDMLAVSQGNVQVLDTGNVLVGWGHSAAYTEFTKEGDVLCDVHFGASAYFSFGRIVSYRVYKGSWIGTPNTTPDAAIADDSVFVSWNGATEVASWQLEIWDGAGLDNMTFTATDQVDRTGFETEIRLPPQVTSYFQVSAKNANGDIIGTTQILQRGSGSFRATLLTVQWGVLIIAVFASACLVCGFYCAVSRYLRRHRSAPSGSYQLVVHNDDDESESETSRLQV
ncbi:hypothetical protein N7462_006717 [Penicillium macrosclerotiorum]|uniref:uncharacterized protein n=1 Tax=Penicillium macrosclerotiorum TaxID=303699 RepID=UPI0025490428|nr:uncharacterized protein N7462_006717 [Penicillium macrosclerotiorum]KAJ5683552.1 hypothetical protein N7462_006717 [Penicillium macrosclerotiorum]